MPQNKKRQDNSDMTTSKAGQKGGQRVRELVEEGKQSEADSDQ